MTDRERFVRKAKNYLAEIEISDQAIERLDNLKANEILNRDAKIQALRAFCEAAMMADVDLSDVIGQFAVDASVKKRIAHGKAKKPPKPGAPPGRGMSIKWQRIIAKMCAGYPQYYSAADVVRLAEEIGIVVKPNTARTQLMSYTAGGHVDRAMDGRYRATEIGAREVGVRLGEPFVDPTDRPNNNQGKMHVVQLASRKLEL